MMTSKISWRRPPVASSVVLCLAALLLARPATAQQAGFYYGTNSLGQGVSVTVIDIGPDLYVLNVGGSGDSYCNGKLMRGQELGGEAGYPDDALVRIKDGRATVSDLQPQFYFQADMHFTGLTTVEGTMLSSEPEITSTAYPPRNAQTTSCTSGTVTFKATFLGTENPNKARR